MATPRRGRPTGSRQVAHANEIMARITVDPAGALPGGGSVRGGEAA